MRRTPSEVLKSNIDRIMAIWEERARREIKAASHQGKLALRDSLPKFIDSLADALSEIADPQKSIFDPNSLSTAGLAHGRIRAETSNYTIDQLIAEYYILRQTIFAVLEEEASLSNLERNYIVDLIEHAVSDAATEFSNYLKSVQETFFRMLVHDLRSPLGTASLLADMIESNSENEENNMQIQSRLSDSLKRVNSMLCRLLDYASIKAGQGLKMHFEQLDMCELIHKTTNEYNFSRTNRFLVKARRRIVGYWDARGITSIIENLASNALKYSTPETPILISVENQESSVVITFHNQGKPIPLVEQPNLFTQFSRAKNVGDKVGWGLGLSIVKCIVESHGGTIGVESSENVGTKFNVRLPIDCRQNHDSAVS